jgi:hypothetical protein
MKNLLLLFVVLNLTACSSFRADTQSITLNCPVPGTTVKVNGDRRECPGIAEARRDKPVTVEGYKAGYDRYFKSIGTHMSTAAKWDLLGTISWGIPIFGLFSAGAYDLDETQVNIDLHEL